MQELTTIRRHHTRHPDLFLSSRTVTHVYFNPSKQRLTCDDRLMYELVVRACVASRWSPRRISLVNRHYIH
ncbi:hypothetical protein E2C01_049046 [Portunus trituberculatus]|uniref:Uncharacterized protein n=1 Tax=Portunus trituberculatus TaxID=210409 RepID=A0A5B7G856_PORTR|nr:hypothetical protein [Portunus trituberculatus]